MPIYSYGFTRCTLGNSLPALYGSPGRHRVPGLIHAEYMAKMQLGAPVFSSARMQLHNLTMFASWESEGAIDDFLASTRLGRLFQTGWHVRMVLVRRWGSVKEFDDLPENAGDTEQAAPVVAVTIARMRLPEVPRFIRWGRPVEELVRDHPGAILSSASIRLPRTVSTFSIWSSQREMAAMVHGHSSLERPKRHADAMRERERRDFHFEFTTLRFKPISEDGAWEGRSNMIPL